MPVIVMGCGGHAKVLISALRAAGREIIGIADPRAVPGSRLLDVSVLGGDEVVHDHAPAQIELVNGIGSMPGSDTRSRIAATLRGAGYRFATVVHPSAVIAESVILDEGVQVMAGCVLQPDVSIGIDSIVNTGASVDHDVMIGAHCHIAPGVTLSGNVLVGDDVHIGTGSSVIQGISIGSGSIIAAGAVVFANIAPGIKFIQPRAARTGSIEE